MSHWPPQPGSDPRLGRTPPAAEAAAAAASSSSPWRPGQPLSRGVVTSFLESRPEGKGARGALPAWRRKAGLYKGKKKKREREHGTERPTALSPQYGDAHPTESGSAEVRRGTKGCKSRDRRAKRRKRRRAGCHVVTNRGKGGLRQTIRQEPRWRCASL